jgi:LmbE family N-acetylglucosaminyl deacetylase
MVTDRSLTPGPSPLAPRAFAVAAHPDDIEFVMAGTLLLLAQAGYEVHYMNLCNGCCGSMETGPEETARIREREARAAAALIGAVFHPPLVNDMELSYEQDALRRLAAVMREVAPEILLVHSPSDYMEDHMNACRLAVAAAFTRGMPNYRVDPPCPVVDQPVTIYHAQPHGNREPLGQLVRPNIYVNVASVMDTKTAMLACHKSQQSWLDSSQGLNSYLATMHELMAEVGHLSSRFTHAEGWRRHLHYGFCAAAADPLVQALGPLAYVVSGAA